MSTSARATPNASPGTVEEFLLRHVRDHAPVRFGELVAATQASLATSRSTAARHIARLTRFGELVRRDDGAREYVLPSPPEVEVPTVLESRLAEWIVLVHADGMSRSYYTREFRVCSGKMRSVRFRFQSPSRHPQWWGSAPIRFQWLPHDAAAGSVDVGLLRFDPPIAPGREGWERYSVGMNSASPYRMYREAPARAGAERSSDAAAWEVEGGTLRSRPVPHVTNRFHARSWLRFQVVLPAGYPRGPASVVVRDESRSGIRDRGEEARIEALSREPYGNEGFREDLGALSLSVSQPRLDRSYQIRWKLPSRAVYHRWLASLARPTDPAGDPRPRRAAPSPGATGSAGRPSRRSPAPRAANSRGK